ncbi:restriction endonuclease type II-like protein [Truncatella angustata]|uniref:Restriction endonuclease type II-like protein n=1 Tax=Truncatella angustata TaxID=152316 RepID=A0A9P8RKG1_9PEZI|nr:restriction endonuclease type II-like protein [Truncatella angustata]KAH6647476.1 restriction endonuclease type II-like protein [Truncatella angustata]
MDDDDFGADSEFLSALATSTGGGDSGQSRQRAANRIQQPKPQKIQQPTPQRLDKAPPANSSGPKIVQPTPQALPQRSVGSSILVSPRQKGNPVLAALRSVAWEYSDIPADYGLGLTTCALFLSLKYHRLHPEYIYTRIRNLQGKYNLRIVLTMVDIPNHEDSLRELSKTSLVNNVTVILCWSAAEAARYLELYKSYEHASFSAIKGQQATSYTEKLVEFVTVPRGINKADAVSLVSAFGSIRNAVNADPEQVAVIGGWGEKKVKRWCSVVEEPFRIQHAAKRHLATSENSNVIDQAVPISRVPLREMPTLSTAVSQDNSTPRPPQPEKSKSKPSQYQIWDPNDDEEDEETMIAAAIEESKKTAALEGSSIVRQQEDQLSEGIAAALAKLRDKD